MEGIFWRAAGPLIDDGEPPAVLLAGMMVCAAGGMLVNLPDTPANLAMFGSAGTADDSSPFPQLRVVALTGRAGRAMLGAILGGSAAGEQTLLKRLVRRRPDPFAGRVTCFDRNFPGYDLIMAILDAGGHVIARVKEGISLAFENGPDRGWLPDGSRLTWLNAPSGKKEDRLPCGRPSTTRSCLAATGRKSFPRPAPTRVSAVRRQDSRSLPSWACGFDSRRPLHGSGPARSTRLCGGMSQNQC
jgi:hypothetical protein